MADIASNGPQVTPMELAGPSSKSTGKSSKTSTALPDVAPCKGHAKGSKVKSPKTKHPKGKAPLPPKVKKPTSFKPHSQSQQDPACPTSPDSKGPQKMGRSMSDPLPPTRKSSLARCEVCHCQRTDTTLGPSHDFFFGGGGQRLERCSLKAFCSTLPPLVVPHPLSFPWGEGGTVTWSTQKVSLRLIVLLCR